MNSPPSQIGWDICNFKESPGNILAGKKMHKFLHFNEHVSLFCLFLICLLFVMGHLKLKCLKKLQRKEVLSRGELMTFVAQLYFCSHQKGPSSRGGSHQLGRWFKGLMHKFCIWKVAAEHEPQPLNQKWPLNTEDVAPKPKDKTLIKS